MKVNVYMNKYAFHPLVDVSGLGGSAAGGSAQWGVCLMGLHPGGIFTRRGLPRRSAFRGGLPNPQVCLQGGLP